MFCKIIKAGFFAVLCFGAFVFSFASTPNNRNERDKQLCYLRKKHIRANTYEYNRRNSSFLHNSVYSQTVSSVILLRREFFKNPWDLKRVQLDVGLSSKRPSVTHWLRYDTNRKNNLNKLCKTVNGECIFKVVYRGDIYPVIERTGSQNMHLKYKNSVRAFIYDGQNNILRFPDNCDL